MIFLFEKLYFKMIFFFVLSDFMIFIFVQVCFLGMSYILDFK